MSVAEILSLVGGAGAGADQELIPGATPAAADMGGSASGLHKMRGSAQQQKVGALDLRRVTSKRSAEKSAAELREERWVQGGGGNWSARNHHSIYGIDEDNLGKVQLAMHRDGGTLRVAVLQCARLKRMDRIDHNDVYVTASVGQVTQRTPTVKEGGEAPRWPGWDVQSLGEGFPAGDGHVMQFDGTENAEVSSAVSERPALPRGRAFRGLISRVRLRRRRQLRLFDSACLCDCCTHRRSSPYGCANTVALTRAHLGYLVQLLTLHCYDEDFGSADDLIGATQIDLKIHPYVATQWTDVDWFTLKHELQVS
jgi:hypothetical protein